MEWMRTCTCFALLVSVTASTRTAQGGSQYVVFECQDRRRCDLFISNTTFGHDPCPGVLKVLTLHYHCRPVELRSRIACEPGKVRLRCPRGSLVVPQHAEFGRSPTTGLHCTTGHAGDGHDRPQHLRDCQSTQALSIVTSRCLGRSKCPLYASSHIFGDPCPFGTWKRLFVIYYCVPVRVLDEAGIHRDETSVLTSHPSIAAPLTSISLHSTEARLASADHRMNSTANSTSKWLSTEGWGFNPPPDLSSTPYLSPSTIAPSTRLRWISPRTIWQGRMSKATQNPLQTRIGHSDLLVTSSLASFGTLAGNFECALLSFMAGVCLGLLLTLAALLPTATPWQGGTKHKPATDGRSYRRGSRDKVSDEDGDSDYSSSASSLLPRYPNSPCVALASAPKECETRPPTEMELVERLERRDRILTEIWLSSGDRGGVCNTARFPCPPPKPDLSSYAESSVI
uniref:protein eva-1 homolog C-like isoform X2 n=1 Tax=Myxine glutinosa TaxID=7769 RepID=UPI00358F7EDD